MPSKYVTKNLLPDEKLVKVFDDTSLFDKTCLVLTNQRIFGWRESVNDFSWRAKSIKNVTVETSFFSKSKGTVTITGPYNKKVAFRSDDVTRDRDLILSTLKLKL